MVPRFALLVVCGCGRVAFDPLDAVHPDAAADGSPMADAAAVDPDLLLHFKFDDDLLRDEVGHPMSCTSCPTPVAGRVGSGAAAFAGAQCLSTADAPELRPAQFTIAAWAKASGLGATRTILGKAYDGASSVENSYELYQDDAIDDWCVVGGQEVACAPTQVGVWQHVVGTYDGIQLVLYLDGDQVATMAAAALQYAADPVRVGCDMNVGNIESFFVGELDDVRLYKRVLAQDEVAALAQ